MAYASASNGGSKGAKSEPSGKNNSSTFASKAGNSAAKSEPSSSKLSGGGMTTKGHAKKL
jgi:hypothetical protein